MAAIGVTTLDDECVTGMPGGGDAGYSQDEVTAMVLGRRARISSSDLQPQFTDAMAVGYQLNAGIDGAAPFMRMEYDKPVATPSRPARMPHWFGYGFLARVDSIAAWPWLGGKFMQRPNVGMTGVTLPKYSVGWEPPRRNIVGNPNMPFGDLTAMYPHIYATGDE